MNHCESSQCVLSFCDKNLFPLCTQLVIQIFLFYDIFTVLVADILVYVPGVFVFSFLCLRRRTALNKVKYHHLFLLVSTLVFISIQDYSSFCLTCILFPYYVHMKLCFFRTGLVSLGSISYTDSHFFTGTPHNLFMCNCL